MKSYFDAVDDLRAEFDTSKAFVTFLHCLHTQGFEVAKKLLPEDHCIDIGELIEIVAPEAFEISSLDVVDIPKSELSRAVQLNNAALKDPEFLDSLIPQTSGQKDLSQQDAEKEIPSTAQLKIKHKLDLDTDDESFGPELLVGKLLRLYCPINNQYHNGRVIDWRSARLVKNPYQYSHQDDFSGKYEIATSEFLVRFPAGMNGRKEDVLTWIVLEEHSCAISVSLIMGLRDKGRGINGWKPAQVVLRTTIELIPVVQRIQLKGNFALIIFFGDDNHLYTDLDDDSVDLFSKKFEQYRISKLNYSPTTSSSYLHSVAEFMDLVMALVRIELEEQRRTYEWHKLIMENYAHPRCFSMRNEYGIPPLQIDELKSDNGVEANKENGDGTLEDDHKSCDVRIMQPNLCPLIQIGLDRQLIWNQITDKRFTLDNAVSLSCSNTKSMSEKIELCLNKDVEFS